MGRIFKRRPGPAMVIAVLALIVALGGTAVAGGGFLTKKKFTSQAVRGPVTYVSTTTSIPPTPVNAQGTTVTALCPAGFVPIGGGIRTLNDFTGNVNDSHPITGGWAGTVNNFSSNTPFNAITTVVCAVSRTSTIGTLQTTS
jgi:hypothetical protein